ncbi:Periplasmic murein peptide-binding protein [subsurface metagenome]
MELWLRQADAFAVWQIPAATYMQAHLKEALGVDIIPQLIENKTYTDAQNQHTHNLFLATYGFDYVDPSNFMDIFLSGGRHAWSSQEYDELVREAGSCQDWEKRMENYRKAETILIQEAPAVFVFQSLNNAVWKPYIKGEGIESNKKGIASWEHMPDSYVLTHIYIEKH